MIHEKILLSISVKIILLVYSLKLIKVTYIIVPWLVRNSKQSSVKKLFESHFLFIRFILHYFLLDNLQWFCLWMLFQWTGVMVSSHMVSECLCMNTGIFTNRAFEDSRRRVEPPVQYKLSFVPEFFITVVTWQTWLFRGVTFHVYPKIPSSLRLKTTQMTGSSALREYITWKFFWFT